MNHVMICFGPVANRSYQCFSVGLGPETHCRETLSMLLREYCPSVQVMEQCDNRETGMETIQKLKPDLGFPDIEMLGMNGFEMLERISAIPFAVIFTNQNLEYLLKPVDHKELKSPVERTSKRLSPPLPQEFENLLKRINHQPNPINKIALPTMEGLQMIAVDSIISCTSERNYTFFLLKNNVKIVVSKILKDVEEMLEEYPFLRVHHSHIVNLNEISKYVKGEGGYLVMSDGSTADVSRSRKETLLRKLQPGRHSDSK